MCLEQDAHGVDVTHPIFHGPLPVTLTPREVPTPEHYRHYPDGRNLGPTMSGWRVCAEPVNGYWGVVADGYGFDDGADREYIAGGVNSKGPRSAALARQGNFFQWGFSAAPKAMTEEARTVFLNVLAYMRRFDGCRPLATKTGRSRDALRMIAGYVGSKDRDTYARNQLPAEVYAAGNAADAERKLDEVLPYLRLDGKKFAVDQDCQALGIANRDPALLERCVRMLAAGEGGEVPRQLLERYTDQKLATADEWRSWLKASGDRLYFSDWYGGRWFVRPADCPAPHRISKPDR
jgi:hypothetical protein